MRPSCAVARDELAVGPLVQLREELLIAARRAYHGAQRTVHCTCTSPAVPEALSDRRERERAAILDGPQRDAPLLELTHLGDHQPFMQVARVTDAVVDQSLSRARARLQARSFRGASRSKPTICWRI